MNGIENYKQGLTIAQDEIYRASILYKIGKSSEGIEQLEKLKNDAYERADKVVPTYKTKYKVARQYMEIGVLDVAIEYFKESLRKLEEYGYYLDPIEQEYNFKIYSHLASLYNSKRDYIEAVKYGERTIDLKNKIYDSKGDPQGYNKLYYEIYQGKSNIDGIISEVLKGMNIKNIYQHLGVAYDGLGLRDISEEYFKLVRVS